nr:hypothetical protein BaRGS_011818 [Batillaria attramentaria]
MSCRIAHAGQLSESFEPQSAGTELKINRKKTELMKINTTAKTPVTVGGEPTRRCTTPPFIVSRSVWLSLEPPPTGLDKEHLG